MKKVILGAFVVGVLLVSPGASDIVCAQDITKLNDELRVLENQLPAKQAAMRLVESNNQTDIAADQQIKRDIRRWERDKEVASAAQEQMKRDFTSWARTRDVLRSDGCEGTTTDRAFYNACQRRINALNNENDRLVAERTRVHGEIDRINGEVDRIKREQQALSDAVLQHTAEYNRAVAEWNDLVNRIKALRTALRDRCTLLLQGGGSANPDVRKQELKHCGNVTFDGADPDLKPLDPEIPRGGTRFFGQ